MPHEKTTKATSSLGCMGARNTCNHVAELAGEVDLLNADIQRRIRQEESMRGALVEAGNFIMRNHTGAASTVVFERIQAALR